MESDLTRQTGCELCKVEAFAIHESYQPWNSPNFDVCLIKTSESIYEG